MEDYYKVIIHKDDIKKLESMADNLSMANNGLCWKGVSIIETNEVLINIIKILTNGK